MSNKSSDSDSKMRAVLTAEEVLAYKRTIGRLARGRVDQPIPNEHPMHAAALIEAMFENAQSDVRIFTGKLASATYDQPELISAAARFLERPGTRLKILIQRPSVDLASLKARGFYGALAGNAKMELRRATGSYSENDASHFAVMDGCGFRFELKHENTQAIANFNDPKVAKELIAAFDTAFSMGRPLN